MRQPTIIHAGARSGAQLLSRTVGEIMHPGVLSCPPDAPLADVAALMAEHRVHAIFVDGVRFDPDGTERHVRGIVSDLDLVGRIDAAGTRTAGDMSATPVVVVEPGEPLDHATRLMHDYDVHHLVVVDPADRRPVGVISTLDVVTAFAAEHV